MAIRVWPADPQKKCRPGQGSESAGPREPGPHRHAVRKLA